MSSSTLSQKSSPDSPFGTNSSHRSLQNLTPSQINNNNNINNNNEANSSSYQMNLTNTNIDQLSSNTPKSSPFNNVVQNDQIDDNNNNNTNKRKRSSSTIGILHKCDHPGCDKSFSRMDHLQRHKLNHNPSTIYTCDVPGCTKTFIRKDVRAKHSDRHKNRILKQNSKPVKPKRKSSIKKERSNSVSSILSSNTNGINYNHISPSNNNSNKIESPLNDFNKTNTNTAATTTQGKLNIIGDRKLSLQYDSSSASTPLSHYTDNGPNLRPLFPNSQPISQQQQQQPSVHQHSSATSSPLHHLSQPQGVVNSNSRVQSQQQQQQQQPQNPLLDNGIPTHETMSSIDSIGFSPMDTNTNSLLHNGTSVSKFSPAKTSNSLPNIDPIGTTSENVVFASATAPATVSASSVPANGSKLMKTLSNTSSNNGTVPNNNNNVTPVAVNANVNTNNNTTNNNNKSPSNSSQQYNTSPQNSYSPPQQLMPPSQMMDWLFGERHIPFTPKIEVSTANNNSNNNNNGGTATGTNGGTGTTGGLNRKNDQNAQSYDMFSDEFFAEIFQTSPKFPNENNHHTLINNEIKNKIHKEIPTLIYEEDFEIPQLERFMELFWLLYHPQYPILHKPSFSTQTAHPLLLLSMIMIGAAMSTKSGQTELLFKSPYKLADSIAEPLRWLICSSDEFRPPPKPWVLQSLILLECYEICYSSRKLHERAYLNHGLKIQLLRRSPMLGGDPLRNGYEESLESLDAASKWQKWIEYESLKRATLMSFYLDTINCTIFGHELTVSAHQIKLTLPIEDIIWESASIDINSFPPQKKTPKFLTALKTLLHGERLDVSSFNRKILLAGLLSIMFQMEEKDLEGFYMEWDTVKTSWKESLSMALEGWRINLCNGNCCNTEIALSVPDRSLFNQLPPGLRPEDTTCKFAVYHIAHTFLRIKQYDFIIYAGAPSRMSVTTLFNDYEFVESRIKSWAMSTEGLMSVIHSYFFLCEMLLSKDSMKEYVYDPQRDPCLYRANVVVSALLIIWAYNFVLEGPESILLKDNNVKDSEFIPAREDGYGYLRRIRTDLMRRLGSRVSNQKNFRFTSPNTVSKFKDVFPKIKCKNYNVGLLRVFKSGFSTSHSEICREYSRMIENCIQRSLGKEEILCADMYN